jgi:hypothetical protein
MRQVTLVVVASAACLAMLEHRHQSPCRCEGTVAAYSIEQRSPSTCLQSIHLQQSGRSSAHSDCNAHHYP